MRGTVEHGDRRGRELGFPTANVAVPAQVCLPADGVYGGTFRGADGVVRLAAISLGTRPTFYDETGMLLLEAHVLDFDGDLYGQPAAVRVRGPHPGPGAVRLDRRPGRADGGRRRGDPAPGRRSLAATW